MIYFTTLVFGVVIHCVSGKDLFLFGRRNIEFSYGYQPTQAPTFTKSMTPTKSLAPISAPSRRPKKTPSPSLEITATSFPVYSSSPFFDSSFPTDSPVVVVDDCVFDNDNKRAFTDVQVEFEVETFTLSLEFLNGFIEEFILTTFSASAFSSTSFCLFGSASTTRRKLQPEDHNGMTIVQVSAASIAEGKDCVAQTTGATCHVVLVSLRVYGKSLEDSRHGSNTLLTLLQSEFANQDGYFGNLSSDIVVIREHHETLVDEESAKDRPDNSSSGRISKGVTATIAVGSILVASIAVAVAVAVFHFGRFRQEYQDKKDSDDSRGASFTDCDESFITGLYTTEGPTLASDH